MNGETPAGLYIHIPFCVSKCIYCDFLSYAPDALPEECAPGSVYKRYANALINELRTARLSGLSGLVFDSVYIGGGTPTALPAPFLIEIIKEAACFSLTNDTEFTVEANPGTLSEDMLAMLKQNGVNRISIGLQAWQDDLLSTLGRAHRRVDFERNFHAARAAGFTNISVDVMFALPGQSMDDWRETLSKIATLNPEHISAYALTPEEGTPLWGMMESKNIMLPSEDTDRDMYALCHEMLSRRGYAQYELSNFSRPGYESRHNNKYWRRVPYYGFGLGAHSFNGNKRWRNTYDLDLYLHTETAVLPREDEQTLTQADAMGEAMFLGLRLTEGVAEQQFEKAFGVPLTEVYGEAITRLTADGLLTRDNGHVWLTTRGMDLANRVFMEFVV